jgi:6-phosphogluconate dehydrogenase
MAGRADIGIVGIGVMGRNLALNVADHRFGVAAFDVAPERVAALLAHAPQTPGELVGCADLASLVRALARPRRILLMIKAGAPVDEVIEQLVPRLDVDDVIIDGGNSLWSDTERREARLGPAGIRFVGCGVSGGAEGARFGPSLMPGGRPEAWRAIAGIWTAIAAKVDPRTGRPLTGAAPGRPAEGGEPCAAHIGPGGSGHYVKMVHNGIEYADMQLIGEAYSLLRGLGGLAADEVADVFEDWNRGDLDSYLIEITAEILRQRDPLNRRRFLVDVVLDTAGQKGTGRWTSVDALEIGAPAPTITEAVFARIMSALKEERVLAGKKLRGPARPRVPSRRRLVAAVHDALYASKVCAYAQGFAQMAQAERTHGFTLDLAAIARIWRGGCIIRARLLHRIAEAYAPDPAPANLMLDPYFRRKLHAAQPHWREIVALAARAGVPTPAFMSALAYYDGYRTARGSADLLQAQRDYFGAHGFERVDRPRGALFHVAWEEPGRPLREVSG